MNDGGDDLDAPARDHASGKVSGSLLAVLLSLLLNAKAGAVPDQETSALLARLLLHRARELQNSDPDGSLIAVQAFPGYLSRSIDGTDIFVPFSLAQCCPRIDVLREVVPLAAELSVGSDAPICIGGSTTFLGKLRVVGDLDFCEYIFRAERLTESVAALIERSGSILLSFVKCAETKVSYPWSDFERSIRTLTERGVPEGQDKAGIKLDFIVLAGSLGLLPASNLVLWVDDGAPELGNALCSFAHQEIVINRGRGVSRSLIDGGRLASYLLFLHTEAGELMEDYPVKALKRSLSLAELLGLGNYSSLMIEVLNFPVVEKMIRFKRLAELEELLAKSDKVRAADFLAQFELERRQVEEDGLAKDEVSELVGEIKKLVGGLVAEVDELLESIGVYDEPT